MNALVKLILAIDIAVSLHGVKVSRTYCRDRLLEFCTPLGRQQLEGPEPSKEGIFELRVNPLHSCSVASSSKVYATYDVHGCEHERWKISLNIRDTSFELSAFPLLDLSIAMLRQSFNNSADFFVTSSGRTLNQTLYLANKNDGYHIDKSDEVSLYYSDEFFTSKTGDGVEIVDWVSEDGESLSALPRMYIHRHNLLHRGMGVLLFDQVGRVFVHQRAASKRIFPSMFDMFIGGVSAAGESSANTLIRELQEEVGIDLKQCESFTETAAVFQRRAGASRQKKNEVKKLLRDRDISEQQQMAIYAMSDILQDSDCSSTGNVIKFLCKTKCFTNYNHCLVDIFAVKLQAEAISKMAFKDGEVQFGEWLTLDELQQRLLVARDKFVPDGLQVWDNLMLSIAADRNSLS